MYLPHTKHIQSDGSVALCAATAAAQFYYRTEHRLFSLRSFFQYFIWVYVHTLIWIKSNVLPACRSLPAGIDSVRSSEREREKFAAHAKYTQKAILCERQSERIKRTKASRIRMRSERSKNVCMSSRHHLLHRCSNGFYYNVYTQRSMRACLPARLFYCLRMCFRLSIRLPKLLGQDLSGAVAAAATATFLPLSSSSSSSFCFNFVNIIFISCDFELGQYSDITASKLCAHSLRAESVIRKKRRKCANERRRIDSCIYSLHQQQQRVCVCAILNDWRPIQSSNTWYASLLVACEHWHDGDVRGAHAHPHKTQTHEQHRRSTLQRGALL